MKTPKKHHYRGKMMTATEIATANGITPQALYSRMNTHKTLSIVHAAEMKVDRLGKRGIPTKHHAAGKSMSLKQWSVELDVPYSTLIKWVRDDGIEATVARIKANEKKERKKQALKSAGRRWNGDLSRLDFDPDLELKRRLSGYLKQGVPIDAIIERERHTNIHNMRWPTK